MSLHTLYNNEKLNLQFYFSFLLTINLGDVTEVTSEH